MLYICHRINNISELSTVPEECGVELDLRDDLEGNVYISHEPFAVGESFEEYLQNYHKKTMILNIKSERIEWKIKELLEKYGINDYFFLDSSFPMIYQLVEKGESKIALRVSEYESIENAKLMKEKVDWIWVDCFSKIPINETEAEELHRMGYKLCLVSPELQGRNDCIEEYTSIVQKLGMDAICTKKYNVDRWKELL